MKELILKYSLFGLTLIAGFFSWLSVYLALNFSGMTAWLFPIICFSIYVIFLSLMAVLIRQEIAFEFVVTASLLFSLIFAFSKWHFVVLVLCVILILLALRGIKKDLDLNIKIDLWKSLYIGKFKMVFALALLISSQYFFMVSSSDRQRSIPKFDTTPITKRLVEPILTVINPNFKIIQEEGLTVDQFIVKSQQEDSANMFPELDLSNEIDLQIPANLPTDQRDELKQRALKQIVDSQANLSQKNQELVLLEGRRQLSQMTGQNLSGSEKISDVFAGLIDKKMNDYFQPGVAGNERSSLFSLIIASVLFLTIWPLGTVLSLLWFSFVIIIFKILVHFGLVEIKLVTVQREMIG
jgi:hypothetical protein